jgi:hypothetical protein
MSLTVARERGGGSRRRAVVADLRLAVVNRSPFHDDRRDRQWVLSGAQLNQDGWTKSARFVVRVADP